MPYSNAAKNAMLDHLGSIAGFMSLHNANPGDTGANEISGGAPAYARKANTWSAAAAGSMDNSNAPVFDIPAGATVAFVGFWSLATGGTFYGYASVTSETFAAQGTYTVTDADLDLNAA
jgi:hypothetical protein